MGLSAIWLGLGVTGLTLGLNSLGATAAIAQTADSAARPEMAQLDLPPLATPAPPRPTLDAAASLAQATPAQTLTDVSPNHWAYTAVQNLVNVEGCLSGYPDGTFHGDAPLTRNEFAAALNACLEGMAEQAQSPSDVSELLQQLRSLQAELDTLSEEVDAIAEDLRHSSPKANRK